MRIPLTLLLCLTTLCIATGDEEVETHHLHAAIGSSVSFPGLKIDQYTMYDLKRIDGGLVVTCHDGCKVRDPYNQRGKFFKYNGTFLLSQLKVEDSGTFEFKINFTVKGIIHLRMWAPVKEPVFKQEVRGNGSHCLVVFMCQAEGDGPFNFTFLKNDGEIVHTEVTTHNSSSMSMDVWDPATSGTISCTVANRISSRTSQTIGLFHPVQVMEAVLLKEEVRGNSSQCTVIVTCLAKGDGPHNFTFLKNYGEILHNEVTADNSSSVFMDGWDLASSGRVSCIVQNQISLQRSPSVELPPPANQGQLSMVFIVIDLLLLWVITASWSLWKMGFIQYRRWQQRQRNRNNNEVSQTSRKLSICSQAFTLADNLLGFMKEIIAVVISIYGGFIPAWCCVLPLFFLLCRTMYWMTILVDTRRKTRMKFSSAIKGFCRPLMWLSGVVGVPVFCFAVLWSFYKYYRRPCGVLYSHYLPTLLIVFVVLLGISYISIKNKKAWTSLFPNGDLGQPEDNRDHHGPVLVVLADSLRGEPEISEQEPIRDNSTEEAPEEHLVPEESQPHVNTQVPCRMAANPTHAESDGTKDGEGQCLLTVEMGEVVLDKDRVANG